MATNAWSRLDKRPKAPPTEPTPGSRVYCWRVGITLKTDADGSCPECGHRNHTAIEDGICGCFTPCDNGPHGHPCTLPPKP